MKKFNLHKIAGVEITICSAEQKIAYNLAFDCHISYQEDFDRVKVEGTETAIDAGVNTMIQKSIRRVLDNPKMKRYDVDAIAHALHTGLRAYMEKPFIATYYSRIGEAFPILY